MKESELEKGRGSAMEALGANLLSIVELSGLFAPFLFICFHLFRPFLFVPVVFICISGGVIFGPIAGSIYSLIGITLSSLLFYGFYAKNPHLMQRIFRLKERLIGEGKELSKSQIILLRLVPFIHFHLLSLCLIEISANFKEYTKASVLTNIPLAFVYTSIGGSLSNLSPYTIILLLCLLLFFLYVLRTKEIIIKWQDFFAMKQTKHTSI
jgi:uncharacterized membrane protein YdjX (TVP38/TMEM64 family)